MRLARCLGIDGEVTSIETVLERRVECARQRVDDLVGEICPVDHQDAAQEGGRRVERGRDRLRSRCRFPTRNERTWT